MVMSDLEQRAVEILNRRRVISFRTTSHIARIKEMEQLYGTKSRMDPQAENLGTIPHDQHAYAETWKKARPSLTILFETTVKGAIEMARDIGKTNDGMQTIITSSQHLVGGAFSLLQRS